MSEVTQILAAIDSGDERAAAQLLPLVYDELRKLAAAKLAQEKPGQTLQATALVHEAYLRLVGGGKERSEVGGHKSEELNHGPDVRPPTSDFRPSTSAFNDRAHFFRAAAESMRRILVDNARRKQSAKHGGDRLRVELPDAPSPDGLDLNDLVAVNDALARFEERDPAKAELVKLRFFAGLTMLQAAQTLGISRATAERHWAYAKAWLFRDLGRQATATSARQSPENS